MISNFNSEIAKYLSIENEVCGKLPEPRKRPKKLFTADED